MQKINYCTNKMHNSKRKDLLFFIFLFSVSLPFSFVKIFNSIYWIDIFIIFLIFISVIKKNYHLKIHTYLFFNSLLFILSALLSLSKCDNISSSLTQMLQHLIILLPLPVVMRLFLTCSDDIQKSMKFYIAASTILAFLIIISSIIKINIPIISTKFATERIIISNFGPNVIARLFLIAALFAFYFVVREKNSIRIAYFIVFLINSYGVVSTISIAGIILLTIGIVWIFVKYTRLPSLKSITRSVGSLLLLLIITSVLYNYHTNIKIIVDKIIYRELANRQTEEYDFHGRVVVIDNLDTALFDNFLIGIGYGQSAKIAGQTIHFPLISSYFETGILGLVSMVGLYFYPVWHIFKRKKIDILSIVAILIFCGDMIQPNPNYRFTWYALYLPTMDFSPDEEK